MRFEIRGASSHSGEDVVQVIDAPDEDAARQWANDAGILIEAIDVLVEMDLPGAWESTTAGSTPLGEVEPDTASFQPAARDRPANPPLDYRGTDSTPQVRKYSRMKFAGKLLRWFAYGFYGLAALWLVIGLYTVFALSSTAQGKQSMPSPFSLTTDAALSVTFLMGLFAPMLALLFAGAICQGLGTICEAVRDIARNSWR
jgi:hypothetical protein